MQCRGSIIFDTDVTGSVYVTDEPSGEGRKDYHYFGDGSSNSRLICRSMLNMFDMGIMYKEREIKLVLGI